MTRMTGPDCAVMCNLTNIHTYIHTYMVMVMVDISLTQDLTTFSRFPFPSFPLYKRQNENPDFVQNRTMLVLLLILILNINSGHKQKKRSGAYPRTLKGRTLITPLTIEIHTDLRYVNLDRVILYFKVSHG